MIIDPFWFIIALGIGLVAVWYTTPEPTYLIKYPTPDNAGKIVYKDVNDVCYKYKAEKVSCPADRSKLKEIPVQ